MEEVVVEVVVVGIGEESEESKEDEAEGDEVKVVPNARGPGMKVRVTVMGESSDEAVEGTLVGDAVGEDEVDDASWTNEVESGSGERVGRAASVGSATRVGSATAKTLPPSMDAIEGRASFKASPGPLGGVATASNEASPSTASRYASCSAAISSFIPFASSLFQRRGLEAELDERMWMNRERREMLMVDPLMPPGCALEDDASM